jgi:uncharacterized membrane protein YkvA (DUF1232 family)
MKIDKDYIKNQSKGIDKEDINQLNKKKNKLRKLLSLSVFAKHKDKAKLLLEIVQNYKNGSYSTIPWRSIAAITFTLLYIINPFDIVPDVLPFIGFVDDLSVFMALSNLVERDVEDYKEWKLSQFQDIAYVD